MLVDRGEGGGVLDWGDARVGVVSVITVNHKRSNVLCARRY